MKDAIKIMLIPIIGILAIGVIFLSIVWSGNFERNIVNKNGEAPASKNLGGYAVMLPTPECDESYFPVCGFDGLTYDNACKAVRNETTVAHRGVCQS